MNGELGLGGIEEEHVLLPRELNFNKTTNIKEGEFNGLCTHPYIINLRCNKCVTYSERSALPVLKEEAPLQNSYGKNKNLVMDPDGSQNKV